jgi:hypothetical protein
MEYIFYILPYYKNHEDNTKCFFLESQPNDLDEFLNTANIETYFENKKCCLKCALYVQLWYNQMIVEKKEIKYTSKSYLSKFSIKNLHIEDTFENISHPTMIYISPIKAKSVYEQFVKQRAYKLSDIEAYDITKELLEYIIEKYEKYNILVFMETYI